MQLQSLLPLLLCAPPTLAAWKEKQVDLVFSVDEYYDQVNSMDSYTMVEYTTTWCHHCKSLRPVFEQLMRSYEEDDSKLPVKFLNVDCEAFGSQICNKMRAFPKINLVVPRDEPFEIAEVDYSSMPLYRRLWVRAMHYLKDPKWQLDEERVFEFDGERDVESLRNFIETIRAKDGQRRLALRVLDPGHTCEEEEEDEKQLCEEGKNYTAKLDKSQLAQELSKLEKLLENNADENLASIKFKLELVSQLQTRKEKEQDKNMKVEETRPHDEL